MLQEADLRKLLASVNTLGTENSLALRILLATCVRSSELTKAKWEDVDIERLTWYAPHGNTKMRRGFYVPPSATSRDLARTTTSACRGFAIRPPRTQQPKSWDAHNHADALGRD